MKNSPLIIGAVLGLLIIAALGSFTLISPSSTHNTVFEKNVAAPGTAAQSASANAQQPAASASPQSASANAANAANTTNAAAASAPNFAYAGSRPAGAAQAQNQPQAAARATPGTLEPRQAEEFQRRLGAMTANGRTPDPGELDALLADMQRSRGSDEMAGVNLAALRENLYRADRIQTLAKEMEQLVQQPNPDLPRIQLLMTQIQQLQAGIHADVRVGANKGS